LNKNGESHLRAGREVELEGEPEDTIDELEEVEGTVDL
jgi:hypothetical protein